MSADQEKTLRKIIWLLHGCPVAALYGDDGEMQCGICLTDFRRMDPDVIDARLQGRGREKLARAQADSQGSGEEKD